MSIGSLSARSGSVSAGFSQKLLALLLALVLVVSMVPRAAWAATDAGDVPAVDTPAESPDTPPVSEDSETVEDLPVDTVEEPVTETETVDETPSAPEVEPAVEEAVEPAAQLLAEDDADAGIATASLDSAEGAVELYSVSIDAPTSLETGTTLQAHAYKGDWSSKEEVTEGVTYTWKYCEGAASYNSPWTTVPSVTGNTFEVTDEYAGRSFIVEATAGSSTKTLSYYSAVGPFKKAGTYDIYSAALKVNGESSANVQVGNTVSVSAREKLGGTYYDIPAEKLTYTWQVSDTKGGTYADLADENVHKASFIIPDSTAYVGKSLRCIVNGGGADKATANSNLIAPADAVSVNKVVLTSSSAGSDSLEPGDTLTARAYDAKGNDVTDKVTAWSWYTNASANNGSGKKVISGATGNTFTVPANDTAYLGVYIVANAVDGFGSTIYAASPKVTVAGAVDLYSVTTTPSTGSVTAGSTVTATAKKIVSVAGSSSTYTADLVSTDTVTYQWQYATSKTSTDSAFADIPGATGKSYKIEPSLSGTYLRVKVASNNQVVSTQKPQYGTTISVDPLGPVVQEGQYTLTSVQLESFTADTGDGKGFQVGSTVVPQAMVAKGSSSEVAAPTDAALTYTWYVADSADGVGDKLAGGYDPADGRLKLTDDLKGTYLHVTANALDNTVSSSDDGKASYLVVGTDEFELLRVTASPSSGDVFPGDTVHATVQARKLNGGTTSFSSGETLFKFEGCTWYTGASPDGPFVQIDGATGLELEVPATAAGQYLKVVAASGASVVERVFSNPVVDDSTLAGIVKKLDAKGFKLAPQYGIDANVNALLKTELASLGVNDVDVSVVSATGPADNNAKATGGVSAASDDTNGDISYLFIDPDDAGWSLASVGQTKVTFKLSRGDESLDYTAKTFSLPWDNAQVETFLNKKAEDLTVSFAAGDSETSVTKSLTLPYKLKNTEGSALSWSEVKWESNSDAVKISGFGWSDYSGTVTRASSDREITLTASVGVVSSGGPKLTIEKTFTLTIPGDPDKITNDKKALEDKVAANFTLGKIKDAETGLPIDAAGLISGDVTLPNQGAVGVDGKYYSVVYEASNDAMVVNGFAGNAYRPLPGAAAASVAVKLTVTDKARPEVTASKTITLDIAPLRQDDISREVELMEATKFGYRAALANGQDSAAVTQNLHAFQKATYDDAGELTWSYDVDASQAAGDGIVPAELDGYDSMSSAGWRLFRSSNTAVVSHENLVVTQPEFNTTITVDSQLTSEKYARYAERYPDNTDFQKLANQPVSASFTVVGTSGQVDPHVAATCSVIGVDKNGAQQTWAAAMPYTLDAGATAADFSEAMFTATGLDADYGVGQWGWALNSLTSPFDAGLSLTWGTFPNKGWSYYVNGKDPGVGAGSYVIQPGDSIIWRYGAWDDPAPTDQLSVSCEVVGVDAQGVQQTWASPKALTADAGATAADLSEQLFAAVGLKAEYNPNTVFGWQLNTITSPFDSSVTLGWDEKTGKYWQLFINGEYALVGASGYTLQAGDTVSWVYGSDGVMPGQVAASAQIIGMDDNGNTQIWAHTSTYKMLEGSTVADLSEQVFAATGLKANYDPYAAYGWELKTITSPFDGGITLGWDAKTGKYWQLFVNGKAPEYGAGSVVLKPGDSVVWAYSTYGSSLPNPDDLVIDPNASRPSYDSSWPGFSNGMSGSVVQAPTPTGSTELSWSYNFREGSDDLSASDPLLVNGRLYLVVNGELRVMNAATGKVEQRANVGSSSAYFNRPVYADGVIIVPSDNGSLTAFTADKLICVWKTKPLDVTNGESLQSLSSLTVAGSYVYAGFTVTGRGESTDRGVLVCVDIRNGKTVWTKDERAANGASMGYYWAGAAVSGNDIVLGDDAGRVRLLDGATGAVLSSVNVGASVRTGIIAVSGTARAATETFVAVTRDGSLHKIVREGDTLKKVGSVSFSSKSTSTPAVANGKAFVGAIDADGYGTLSVIDLATMSVERTVRGGQGEAQGAPLVSVQGGGTYVYFTCNGRPGGVYGYHLGDESAYLLYAPPADKQQYSTSSIIADAFGNLYYLNDSGNLFALKGAESVAITFETNGGSYVAPYRAAKNKPLVRPVDPTREGYTFDGWYVDKAGTRAWDFDAPVTASMTLYANWNKVAGSGGGNGTGGGAGVGGGTFTQPSTTLLPTGTVGAAHAPLAQKAAGQAKEDAASQKASASKADGGKTKARATDYATDAGAGSDVSSGVNPWAVGGIALGVVGLACATGYVVRARRKIGGAQ